MTREVGAGYHFLLFDVVDFYLLLM
jgi:hypothetical protein